MLDFGREMGQHKGKEKLWLGLDSNVWPLDSITLSLPAELQGQNGSGLWVLEILFHGVEASK